MHPKGVGVEFDLGDLAPSRPEMREDGKTGNAAQAEFGIGVAAKVIGGDGGQNLVTKGFVGFLISSESGLIVVKEAVNLSDGGSSGGDGMDGLAWAVDWSEEGDAARA